METGASARAPQNEKGLQCGRQYGEEESESRTKKRGARPTKSPARLCVSLCLCVSHADSASVCTRVRALVYVEGPGSRARAPSRTKKKSGGCV